MLVLIVLSLRAGAYLLNSRDSRISLLVGIARCRQRLLQVLYLARVLQLGLDLADAVQVLLGRDERALQQVVEIVQLLLEGLGPVRWDLFDYTTRDSNPAVDETLARARVGREREKESQWRARTIDMLVQHQLAERVAHAIRVLFVDRALVVADQLVALLLARSLARALDLHHSLLLFENLARVVVEATAEIRHRRKEADGARASTEQANVDISAGVVGSRHQLRRLWFLRLLPLLGLWRRLQGGRLGCGLLWRSVGGLGQARRRCCRSRCAKTEVRRW